MHNDELPEESIYADDTDFISANMQYLDALMEVIPQILREWNLFVNIGKTERTRIGATLKGRAQNEEGKPGLEKEVDGDDCLRKVKKTWITTGGCGRYGEKKTTSDDTVQKDAMFVEA